jgi:hypothetical protein
MDACYGHDEHLAIDSSLAYFGTDGRPIMSHFA